MRVRVRTAAPTAGTSPKQPRKRPPIQGPLFKEDPPPKYLSRKFPFLFRTLNMLQVITSRMLCPKEKRKWKLTAQIFRGGPP
jgi:hypothetical protein